MLAQPHTVFLRLTKITLSLVYLVILAGAVVRATGSGMGCPDWPKCFGRWVPPTNVSQLPANYNEIYKESYADTTFNVYHTWTEYINRLMGALLGFAVFALLIAAIYYYRKTDKRVVLLCFIGFMLVGFQGWLGAKVVSSNLAPVKITIHMLIALIILALFIYIISCVKKYSELVITPSLVSLKKITVFCLIVTVVQIILGTQVREQIDVLAAQIDDRGLWIQYVGSLFKIHRSIAWLIVFMNGYLLLQLRKLSVPKDLWRNAYLIIGVILSEVIIGVILSYYAFPRIVQPLHLLMACILFGAQFMLLNRLKREA